MEYIKSKIQPRENAKLSQAVASDMDKQVPDYEIVRKLLEGEVSEPSEANEENCENTRRNE